MPASPTRSTRWARLWVTAAASAWLSSPISASRPTSGVRVRRGRRPEQGHDRVAEDLVDLAAEGGDVGDQSLEAPVDEVLEVLGVHRLAQRREPHEIGEENGDHTAFVDARLEGVAAGGAEPSLLGNDLAARPTRHEMEDRGGSGPRHTSTATAPGPAGRGVSGTFATPCASWCVSSWSSCWPGSALPRAWPF